MARAARNQLPRVALALCFASVVLACRSRPNEASIVPKGPRSAPVASVATLPAKSAEARAKTPVLRPISPQSGSEVWSSRLQLRWAGGAARVELSRARGFETVVQTASGDGAAEVNLTRGAWYWRIRSQDGARLSVTFGFRVEPLADHPNTRGALVGADFNGDGFADASVESAVVLGRVGSAFKSLETLRLSAARLHIDSLERAADELPLQWGTPRALGDVDGDGYTDAAVAVARRANSEELRRRLDVWLRGGHDLRGEWPAEAPLSGRLQAVGDVDEDGFADVVDCANGCRILAGGTGGVTSNIVAALSSVTRVQGMDLDCDGHVDVLGTDPKGEVFTVWFGPLGSGVKAPMLSLPAAARIKSLHGAFDVNGDGCEDAFGTLQSAQRASLFALSFPTRNKPELRQLALARAFEEGLPESAYFPALGAAGHGLVVLTTGALFDLGFVNVPLMPELAATLAAYRPTRASAHRGGPLNIGDFNGDGYDDLWLARSGDADGVGYDLFLGGRRAFDAAHPSGSAPSGADGYAKGLPLDEAP